MGRYSLNNIRSESIVLRRIIEMMREGKSYIEIAKILKMDLAMISAYVKDVDTYRLLPPEEMILIDTERSIFLKHHFREIGNHTERYWRRAANAAMVHAIHETAMTVLKMPEAKIPKEMPTEVKRAEAGLKPKTVLTDEEKGLFDKLFENMEDSKQRGRDFSGLI